MVLLLLLCLMVFVICVFNVILFGLVLLWIIGIVGFVGWILVFLGSVVILFCWVDVCIVFVCVGEVVWCGFGNLVGVLLVVCMFCVGVGIGFNFEGLMGEELFCVVGIVWGCVIIVLLLLVVWLMGCIIGDWIIGWLDLIG